MPLLVIVAYRKFEIWTYGGFFFLSGHAAQAHSHTFSADSPLSFVISLFTFKNVLIWQNSHASNCILSPLAFLIHFAIVSHAITKIRLYN